MKTKDIQKIIKGCIDANTKAQHKLYELYAPKMMGLCFRYTKNQADAEDVFQEGFIKVFEKIHQLQNMEMVEWWIKKVFINEALQLLKNRKKLNFADEYNYTNLTNRGAEEILGKLGVEEITKIIQELPSGMQMVVNLYIIEGFPHKEIAKLLGISEGTSKSQLHDARKILKQKLIQHY